VVKTIEAAGAVVLRAAGDGAREVLAVHRPRYQDWSLPKGKLEPGESLPAAAVREVAEETAHSIRLMSPLDDSRHRSSKSAEKRVSWWHGLAVAEAPVELGDPEHPVDESSLEVDQVAWLSLTEAAERLSYQQDRELLAQAAEQPTTTPLIVVRHAKAVSRKDWDGSDPDRPLRARGRVQSRRLVPLLAAYGVQELITSPWLRCAATLQPYSLEAKIRSTALPILNEEEGSDDPDGVAAAIEELRERAVVGHRPIAICGHRPVLPHMLAALDLPARPLATAECVVVHLTDTGEVHAVERHRPRI
jgi:8-oxo-dGTP diphosphatase